ncbi:ArsC family transcriptional regulator [Nibricoccus aquaticus]|uniref:ArsC family transcriptional regulator n=1 Tax=Nibricoccus aquaticus TaxID=2576891 RepID=A0A290QBP1_9BACT|nr:Spx/MgsR family RNA polymerase-binding regulatory protein [Nibricoccus aquaticus]ATC66115.1 ArsC family transcriptional regulator [Nibricoccus aquaticus]
MITVYTYAGCDSCRKAVKWLKAEGVAFEEKPIRETPPTVGELRAMLKQLGGSGELRRLFNTAGQDYRALGLKDTLPAMSEAEALGLLAKNGNLVKRPFLLGKSVGLVGFDAGVWAGKIKNEE